MNENIRPTTGTRIEVEPHASRGIGKPYPKEIREAVLQLHLLGMPFHDEELDRLRIAKKWPCNTTRMNWLHQYHNMGHVLPKRRTENIRSSRELRGLALVNLAIYITVRPKATISEVKAFLFNMYPYIHPYSDSQI